jgi:hypothetical protein
VDSTLGEVCFTLFDKEHFEEVNEYRTKLKKNGSFKIKVKEQGEYFLMQTGATYPSFRGVKTMLSNNLSCYFYNFKKGEVIKLDDIYISNTIKIINPGKDTVCTSMDELVFEWEEISFADFYTLNIIKINEEDEEQLLISTRKIKNKIEYKTIRTLEIIGKKKLDLNKIVKLDSYNTMFNELNKGKYKIGIIAYKIVDEKKDFLMLSNTHESDDHYFVIQ